MSPALTLTTFSLHDAERELIGLALKTYTTHTEAAQALGISRHALARRMRRHNLERMPEAKAEALA